MSSYSPSGKRTFVDERQTTRPINARSVLTIIYHNARTSWENTISGLLAWKVRLRFHSPSLASRVYKEHLLICELEMVPRLRMTGMSRVWFVRVRVRWLSDWRVQTHVLRPPHSFETAQEAVERGFRYGELWVDQKKSKPRDRQARRWMPTSYNLSGHR